MAWGQDAESLYEELCADVRAAYARVPLLPGARDFLQELACAGIPMVMASSTPVRELRSCLETHGIAGFFKDVVSTEDVGGRDKEFPDVYEEALRRLGHAQGVHVGLRGRPLWRADLPQGGLQRGGPHERP